MAETSASQPIEFRDALHELNQRYKHAWDRAERLQDELNHIKNSRAYRFVCWLRSLTRLGFETPQSVLDHSPASVFSIENLDNELAPASGTVTILVPFKDRVELLRNCVRSLRRSTYRQVEILLLDNGSSCPRTLRYLQSGEARFQFRVIPCPGPFNFSRICNLGARRADGDFLLFLNNDVEILTPDWLEHLLQLGNRSDVGAVGATLLYPNHTIQHAGVFPNGCGEWSHVYRGLPHDHLGEFNELRRARSVPAVTGACLMIRRDLFNAIGGFDEQYALTHNDIDLCVRIRKRGLKIAVTPHARLWHFESMSRGYSRELIRLSVELQ